MKNLNPIFHTIYHTLIKTIIQRNPNLDPDSFTIDFSNETPNTISFSSEELTIGSFLDSLIYNLSLMDIEPKTYTITEIDYLYHITITEILP